MKEHEHGKRGPEEGHRETENRAGHAGGHYRRRLSHACRDPGRPDGDGRRRQRELNHRHLLRPHDRQIEGLAVVPWSAWTTWEGREKRGRCGNVGGWLHCRAELQRVLDTPSLTTLAAVATCSNQIATR